MEVRYGSEDESASQAQKKTGFAVLRGGGRNPPVLRLLSYTSG